MVNRFLLKENEYLTQAVYGFFHAEFGGVDHPNNPNFLYKFKNDPHHNWNDAQLQWAKIELKQVLRSDLPEILRFIRSASLTVCVVPRAKSDCCYRADQLLFRTTVSECAREIIGFQDGTNFISRHTNTRTTHLRKPVQGYLNDGAGPYPGIAEDTCHFSYEICGRHILLVDDIYTRTVNIDEDMVQALFNKGARFVVFYAIGNTVRKF